MIAERNIFNPDRSPRGNREAREPRSRPREVVTLVGTLSSEKGSYAFFDSSRPELRKAIEIGKTIAGHKVVGIGTDTISLQWKTNTFQLRIGGQLQRTEGSWEANAGVAAPANEAKPESKTLEVAEDDVIKRLIQKREQELKGGE
jgi:hypothetical protein